MKALITHKKRQRIRYYNKSKSYYLSKALLHNSNLRLGLRIKYSHNLFLIGKKSHTTIRNTCIETNRSRALIGHFKLSRIMFREKASFAKLPGVRKSSW